MYISVCQTLVPRTCLSRLAACLGSILCRMCMCVCLHMFIFVVRVYVYMCALSVYIHVYIRVCVWQTLVPRTRLSRLATCSGGILCHMCLYDPVCVCVCMYVCLCMYIQT